MRFAKKIINWYNIYKRELLWRGEIDPYKVWISEIILQQTRVDQGTSYYKRFVERFDTVEKLANAHEDEVLKLWQGLGYYSRARNLHHSAKLITQELDGNFPSSYTEIIKLKGVGPYVAAAIASIVFNEPIAAIDGNVYRVLSRIFGIEIPIDTTAGKKYFQELGNKLISKEFPGDYNQAVMEFGAMLCLPRNPKCDSCPFSNECIALENKTITSLPIKSKKTSTRKRFFNYLVITHRDKILIGKRTKKDIWQGLYEFPLIETTKEEHEQDLMNHDQMKVVLGNTFTIKNVKQLKPHKLSHQQIFARIYFIEKHEVLDSIDQYVPIQIKDISNFAVPRILEETIKMLLCL